MNILFSTIDRLSIPSAQRTHISEIVNNLAELNNKVHLIALDKGNLELHKNVVFHRIGPRTNRRFVSLISLRLQAIYTQILINRILTKESIDVTYERHNLHDYATRISHKGGIPAVVEVNGIPSLAARFFEGMDKKTAKKIEISELTNLQFATKIIAVTEGIRDYYVSLGVSREKIVVIPNGVNVDIFRPLNKKVCRKELELNHFPLITFVGQFRPYQGLEHAVKAMPYILRLVPDAKLMLVGDAGEYEGFKFKPTKQSLKSLARKEGVQENVIFTGRVQYQDVPKYINASDVCLCLSSGTHLETTGASSLKIFEYLACGKPTITSEISGNRDLVLNSNSGFAVKSDHYAELAGTVAMLLNDGTLRQRMGENGRRYVVKNHDWKSIARRITQVCKSAMEM